MIVSGQVVRGLGMASKTLGCPTANLKLDFPAALGHGVYVGIATLGDQRYPAVISFGADGKQKFEVHLLDQDMDLLYENMEVDVGQKISEMAPWESEEQMRGKIQDDIALARKHFEK